jgi:hypothetical protein
VFWCYDSYRSYTKTFRREKRFHPKSQLNTLYGNALVPLGAGEPVIQVPASIGACATTAVGVCSFARVPMEVSTQWQTRHRRVLNHSYWRVYLCARAGGGRRSMTDSSARAQSQRLTYLEVYVFVRVQVEVGTQRQVRGQVSLGVAKGLRDLKKRAGFKIRTATVRARPGAAARPSRFAS